VATNTEKIDALTRVADQLLARVDKLDDEVEWYSEQVETLRQTDGLLRERLAVVEREVETLKKSGDEWGRRWWGLFLLVLGAVVGGLVTYFLKR
jgi:predicted nuclease with TOPRIM domain